MKPKISGSTELDNRLRKLFDDNPDLRIHVHLEDLSDLSDNDKQVLIEGIESLVAMVDED